ncbi:MAG: aminodeoxychorismate synthase component I [Bacteroidetes bacterium]|nr:aminodeoxychorismate synthase component I [Bacteroidota bacterium]
MYHISINSNSNLLGNLLALNSSYSSYCLLNSNCNHQQEQGDWNKQLNKAKSSYLLGLGEIDFIGVNKNCMYELDVFTQKHKGKWLFGCISYDIKNEIEKLESENYDGLEFPLIHFFVPKYVVEINENNCTIHSQGANDSKEEIDTLIAKLTNTQIAHPDSQNAKLETINLETRNSKQEYLAAVNKLKQHIQLGDIYEVNYCMEFFAQNVTINPITVYEKLNTLTMAPFSAFYKNGSNYALCGSPERFIKKEGSKISSQPIKGTAKRFENKEEDELAKKQLFENKKERSENVMIVDLVRNDLSRIATRSSVQVEELFGVYTFKSVHQLISTISAEVKPDLQFIDILEALFPMGSMTGAPKIRAMQLIEQYEKTKRGLYSGSIGYIKPNGDFDFNVVIRSILYNEEKEYVSFMTGSAITANCEAEMEYEECLLKAEALAKALR